MKKAFTLLQLINKDQEFSNELDDRLRNTWNIYDCGLDYNAVAVIGSQSTGKSTILNRLFGTTFDVMDEKSRGQTTKGIWLGKANEKNLLVLDLEGSDGRERGDDQDFERKAALFALAIAEVVIVNMWETTVGLYNAANMALLRTVLEVNLQLFQRQDSPKTHLFFLIRDHASNTPLKSLENTIHEDLERIWKNISSHGSTNNFLDSSTNSVRRNLSDSLNQNFDENEPPNNLKSKGSTDSIIQFKDFDSLFEVTVFSLPHMKLQKESFENSLIELRNRFLCPNDKNFAFSTNCRKNVPVDGFNVFARTIWESIMKNKDLDLPTQQELLAQFRCDALGADALKEFVDGTLKFNQQFMSQDPMCIVDNLGSKLDALSASSMLVFDKKAKRYNTAVYKKKRMQLINSMLLHAASLFTLQTRHAHRIGANNFKNSIENLSTDNENFKSALEKLCEDSFSNFIKIIENSKMLNADWNTQDPFKLFKDEIYALMDAKKHELSQEKILQLQNEFKKVIAFDLDEIFSSHPLNLIELIENSVKSHLEDFKILFIELASTLGLSTNAEKLCLIKLQSLEAASVQNSLENMLSESALHLRMKNDFEKRFRYDKDGIPRVWKPSHNMEELYKRAKELPLRTLHQLADFALDWPKIMPESSSELDGVALEAAKKELKRQLSNYKCHLLSKSRLADVLARFKMDADAIYMDAKRSIIASNGQVPWWILVLLAVLGWNEFIYLLSSPIALISLALFGSISYFFYITGLAGPVIRASKIIVQELSNNFTSQHIVDGHQKNTPIPMTDSKTFKK